MTPEESSKPLDTSTMSSDQQQESKDEITFVNPTQIFKFCQSVRLHLVALDQAEGCTHAEDKRENVFIEAIFQRFALLFYYMHYQNDIVDQLIEVHGKCPSYVQKLMISMKAVECRYLEIRNKVEVVSENKNAVIQTLEQRQMQLSAELVHHKQAKQGLATQCQNLQRVLGERDGQIKEISAQLWQRENEVILAKQQRKKLRKTFNQLEEQF